MGKPQPKRRSGQRKFRQNGKSFNPGGAFCKNDMCGGTTRAERRRRKKEAVRQ